MLHQGELALAITTECERYLGDRLLLLQQQLENVDRISQANELPDAIITASGLRITPLANAVPDEADILMQRAYALLPHVKITELPLEDQDLLQKRRSTRQAGYTEMRLPTAQQVRGREGPAQVSVPPTSHLRAEHYLIPLCNRHRAHPIVGQTVWNSVSSNALLILFGCGALVSTTATLRVPVPFPKSARMGVAFVHHPSPSVAASARVWRTIRITAEHAGTRVHPLISARPIL